MDEGPLLFSHGRDGVPGYCASVRAFEAAGVAKCNGG